MSEKVSRRGFNKASAAAAGITILANSKSARGTPANEKMILGLIGCGGRGPNLAKGFIERGDCEFAYMADPDKSKLDSRVGPIAEAQGGKAPQLEQDFRKILEDKSLDAVVIATPDHKENFLSCIKSRELPNADVLHSHLSCAMIHYANASYRLGGQKLEIDPQTEFFTNSDEGNAMLRREYRKPWIIEDEV